jgi:hypothetical protein
LRPTVLLNHLKEIQRRPTRFKPEAFLEALFGAYDALVSAKGKTARQESRVVRLLDIYDLLTLLPGQSREFSRQEFARDIYLLDESGVTQTRRGYRLSFAGSTGTKAPGSVIRAVAPDGREQLYYGISFSGAE